jgi:hypothetical protein
MSDIALCGRSGLAKILDTSESTTRNLERAGRIRPKIIIGNRPLYSIEEAEALRSARDASPRGRRPEGQAVA